MNKKIILAVLGIFLMMFGFFYFLYPKLFRNQNVEPQKVYTTPDKNEPDIVLPPVSESQPYATLNEYENSINYSCNVDSDCEIKDVHNCCGAYPVCTNSNAKTDPDFVRKACDKEDVANVCGFDSVDSCKCVNNKCQGYLKE